ncbi:hypothetical protein BHM03_00026323 [Ensete ventricosum]|nr:hypothetical protein BHM03_00026323 [Ensete ventricosum]
MTCHGKREGGASTLEERNTTESCMLCSQRSEVMIKGPGLGRDAALRAIRRSGILLSFVRDVTPMPHNGCRPPKKSLKCTYRNTPTLMYVCIRMHLAPLPSKQINQTSTNLKSRRSNFVDGQRQISRGTRRTLPCVASKQVPFHNVVTRAR